MIELDIKFDQKMLKQMGIIGLFIMILFNIYSGLFFFQVPNYGDIPTYIVWFIGSIFKVFVVGTVVLISIKLSEVILKILPK